jgi:hypothetical protein
VNIALVDSTVTILAGNNSDRFKIGSASLLQRGLTTFANKRLGCGFIRIAQTGKTSLHLPNRCNSTRDTDLATNYGKQEWRARFPLCFLPDRGGNEDAAIFPKNARIGFHALLNRKIAARAIR